MAGFSKEAFKTAEHQTDLCVVGGGMAGLCAALSAARHGAQVVLMHDRPVLGGNASSECRVHICGADRHNRIKNMRETGILEELRMENLYHNPNRSFSVWDTILFEKAMEEPNILLLLNCTCLDAETDGNHIVSVTGWQLTTQTYHRVHGKVFADCSGDAVLAPLTGAEHRMGREARSEYGESIAPATADACTMGMTCLFQAKEYPTSQPFESPSWAERYEDCDELPYGARGHNWWQMGYWWVELGGEDHGIHDTERLRDELLKIVFGVWDHVKNRCPKKSAADKWALEWVQFLPAKRESRRYLGAHVLTQSDIESEGRFDDVVAYGGWTMDDHHPAGFRAVEIGSPATVFHPAPSPYGISYRCLYSRNVANLMFAGRNASCSHTAMSSTRVMGTGCSMGQALGTAASMAISKDVELSRIDDCIDELQQKLLVDDAYLPWVQQRLPDLTVRSEIKASAGDPEPVRDGINRPVGEALHGWECREGDWIAYLFPQITSVNRVDLVMDSGLDKCIAMSYLQKDDQLTSPPPTLPRDFRLEGLVDDRWTELIRAEGNYRRFRNFAIRQRLEGVRFVLERTWGAPDSCVYSFSVE